MTRLIALARTNFDKSANRQLLGYIARHFVNKTDIELMEIKDIPLFNKGLMHSTPASAQEKEAKAVVADGVIIATPEYDHSIPAALQSALEWFSVGQHPSVDKPVMIVGASCGTLGSLRIQTQFRQILGAPELCVYTMPSLEYHLIHPLQAFDENDMLEDSEQIRRLEALFTDSLVFIKITSQLTETHAQHQKEAEVPSWEELER